MNKYVGPIIIMFILTLVNMELCFAAADGENGLEQVKAGREGRLALVIGNAAYRNAPLKNPANDARDMAGALARLGFKVIHLENAGKREMVKAINTFGRQLHSAGVGLVYFSGHGMQSEGRNYLIPIGARIETESDLEFEAVNADRILGKMELPENKVNIVILDACRNNPFRNFFRARTSGLAEMNAPTGSLVAFATAPGSVAADGKGRNGTYTKYLLRHMNVQGRKIEDVFKQVRIDVLKETQGKQTPWESSSLTGDFYFVDKGSIGAALAPAKPLPGDLRPNISTPAGKPDESEIKWLAWQRKMGGDYAKVEKYDFDPTVKPKEKIYLWKRFLNEYSIDNPYSREDDTLRRTSTDRLAYWQNIQTEDKTNQISFTVPNYWLWQSSSGAYTAVGESDTFAWSNEVYTGDFKLSVDFESNHYNGEGLVVIFGNGISWSPGCLAFNVSHDYQSIRAQSVYSQDGAITLAQGPGYEMLDKTHNLTIEVKDDKAMMYVDGVKTLQIALAPQVKKTGKIGLYKHYSRPSVTYRNIKFIGSD